MLLLKLSSLTVLKFFILIEVFANSTIFQHFNTSINFSIWSHFNRYLHAISTTYHPPSSNPRSKPNRHMNPVINNWFAQFQPSSVCVCQYESNLYHKQDLLTTTSKISHCLPPKLQMWFKRIIFAQSWWGTEHHVTGNTTTHERLAGEMLHSRSGIWPNPPACMPKFDFYVKLNLGGWLSPCKCFFPQNYLVVFVNLLLWTDIALEFGCLFNFVEKNRGMIQ